MRLLKISIKYLLIIGWLSFSLFIIKPVYSYSFTTDSGLDSTAKQTGYDTVAKGTPEAVASSIAGYAGTIINMLVSLAGTIFLILMIYGGATWMTAAGDEKKIEKAKNAVIASIIGLVVVLAAYAITAFIGTQVITWKN